MSYGVKKYRMQPPQEGAPGADLWSQETAGQFVIVSRKAWQPPTDIYETPHAVVIKMELAGIREGDLDIAITGEVLTVRGLRRDESEARKTGYHHLGIAYGECACDISLPGPVERDQIAAEYEAGFLLIRLPKAAPRRSGPVRVQVNSQAD
jgi:HSP20 family protein